MENGKQTYKLPEGWIEVEIKDISLKLNYGYTAKSTTNNTGTKFLRITDIQENYVNWSTVPYCEIDEYDRPKYILNKGDIVFARTGATVGKSYLIGDNILNTVFASYLIRIQLSNFVEPKFVFYYFQSGEYWKQIGVKASGVGQPHVNANSLSKLKLRLPSKENQNRIVSKIESLFSELDQAEKGLQIAKQQLVVYKQALLKSAFNISQGKTSKLGDNISKITQTIKPNTKSEFKFIGLDSINPGSTKLQLIHKFSNFSSSGSYFRKGNILYSRMRPNLNKVYKAEFEGVCSGEFFVLKCEDKLNADYLKYLLHSIEFVSYATNKAKGDRPRLSYGDFASFKIKIIPIAEQLQIVEELDNKFTLIENVVDTINKCFKEIEFLRYSVLKKAFEGKLVQNDTSYESVEKLLSNIKVEKKEYLQIQRESLAQIPKRIQIMENDKTVWQILINNKTAMRSDKLWSESKHKDDIDAFYAEVKELIDAGKVVEDKRQGKVSYLKIK